MVSATMLSSYLYCPRKLFINSVLKVEEPPKEELVKGKVWHKAHELLNNEDESIVKNVRSKNYDDIYDIYRRSYAKLLRRAILMFKDELRSFNIKLLDLFKDYWPNFDSEAKLRALNLADFIGKHNIFGNELWDKLDPKILSEKYFKSESLNLSGIIDMIEVYNNDFYVPVELKTGKVPQTGVWDGHRIQIAAYMLLLEDKGKKTGEGYVKYKGADDKRVLTMNTFLREEVLKLISEVDALINGFTPPIHTDNKNKCRSCPHKDVCYDEAVMTRLINDSRATIL